MYSCDRLIRTATTLLCRDALPRAADDPVYDAVLDGLLRTHYVVAVGVALYLLDRLARVVREDLVQPVLGLHQLLGVDLDVRDLPRETPVDGRLVQQYPRVRQRTAL